MYAILNSKIIDSTRFMYVPIDIISHIILINEQWALKILKKPLMRYRYKLIKRDINNINEMLEFAYKSGLGMRLDNYRIHYKGKLYDKEKLFNKLITCKCCKRHQKLRPIKFEKWYDTEFHNTQNWHDCMCPCRNISRHICKTI